PRCWRRSTRSSSTGAASAGCSASTTGSRSTRPSASAGTATTSCRSSTRRGCGRGWRCAPGARTACSWPPSTRSRGRTAQERSSANCGNWQDGWAWRRSRSCRPGGYAEGRTSHCGPRTRAGLRRIVANLLEKLLRTGEGRTLKRLRSYTTAINALSDEFEALSDAELREETDRFKQRHQDGESLDALLPEAYAAVREPSSRTVGLRHVDVQLMGGAALHLGNIAEMKTGEGKTLVATAPAYLNALTGKGVHVITVNDFLADYQSNLMGRVFR